MLTSYELEVHDGKLCFPEVLKEQFLETRELVLRDGTRVSPAEIWYFMAEEGPRTVPSYFDAKWAQRRAFGGTYRYVELLSAIKFAYLIVTAGARCLKLREAGMPIVMVQGGQTVDPYYAAKVIPLRPGYLSMLEDLSSKYQGMDKQSREFKGHEDLEEANRIIAYDVCHQAIHIGNIRKGVIPVDIIAPYTCLRCSDVAFITESYRDSERPVPTFIMDYPIGRDPSNPWMVDYVVHNIRLLVQKLDELTGRQTTEDDFQASIRLQNKIRKLGRDFMELWRSATVPPSYSRFMMRLITMAADSMADPVATAQVMEEVNEEMKERVENSVKGIGLASHPVRLFISGSCIIPDCRAIDYHGGVLVGNDDRESLLLQDVEEEGDPYTNYARAILGAPYELPTAEKALWVAEQIRQDRADGLIFGYHWGCNHQSAIARMLCDIVRKETGVPTLILSANDLESSETGEQMSNRIAAFLEMFEPKQD